MGVLILAEPIFHQNCRDHRKFSFQVVTEPLKQLIEEPTHITPFSSTLLDLILANSANVSKTGIYMIRKFKWPKSKPKILKVHFLEALWKMNFLEILELLIGPAS